MNFLTDHLLSWILFLPAIGAVLLLFIPGHKEKALRVASLVISIIPLLLTLYLWGLFGVADRFAMFSFEEMVPWFPAINSSYHLGIDGLSLFMLPLTGFLSVAAVLVSWDRIRTGEKAYFISFLVLETGILGVFTSLDAVLSTSSGKRC